MSTSEEAKARNALKKEYSEFMQTIPTGGKVRLIDMMSALDTAYETDISADENAENEHNFKHIFKRMTQPVRDLYEKFNTLDYTLSQGSATKEEFEQTAHGLNTLLWRRMISIIFQSRSALVMWISWYRSISSVRRKILSMPKNGAIAV